MYRALHYKIILIILLAFLLSFLKAQNPDFRFKHLTINEGLSNNLVRCVIQDGDGFMWFGTNEGLNKYNGYEIKVYKKNLNDVNSLVDNTIMCFFIDDSRTLWIGTSSGICYYDKINDHFKIFNLPQPNSNINTANRVINIFQKEQQIYFITEIGILYRLDGDQPTKILVLPDQHNIKCNLADHEGNYWFGGMNGIVKVNMKTGSIKTINSYFENNIPVKIGIISSFCEDGEFIWTGTENAQLLKVDKRSLNVTISNLPIKPINNINSIKIEKGLLYLACGDGLFIYDKKSDKISKYVYEINNPNGLNSSALRTLYFDRHSNLWVGTMQDGINFYTHGKEFKNYDLFSHNLKLDNKSILSVKVDSKDNWWLGSFYGGLNQIDPQTGRKKHFVPDGTSSSLAYGSVMNVFEDKNQNIWTCTYDGYLQKFNPKSNSFTSFPFNYINNGLKEVKDVRSMVEDNQGNLWFISHGFGLFKFNPQTNKYKYFERDENNIKSSLPDNYAYQIVKQNDSILWIATPSGLSKFNLITEKFTNYFYNPADSATLSNNCVNTILIDSKKNIWLGTLFGLNLFLPDKNVFYHYFEQDGLPGNQIKSLIEDNQGRLWLATGNGLTCVSFENHQKFQSRPKLKFTNYDQSDGMQDIFFWERAVDKDKNGQLVFGSENGLVAFNPDRIKDNTELPGIYITDFYLFSNKVEIGDFDSLLTKSISFTKEIRLKYDQNIIRFNYVAVNYNSPEKNQYAYMMIGFDQNWNYVGNKREATYTNLDPGEYIFKVIASNNDGYWNKEGASLKIVILPPWWKTWWFRFLIGILFISSIISFYYLRFSFYRNQQRKLTIMVEERTFELEEKTAQLEERQEEINQQNEELFTQRDALANVNKLLTEQKQQILDQNQELFKHRNELEKLVEKRTSELKAAKERAEESDKLKSSFLANLSHEIRTPLNAIMGFSSIITESELSMEDRIKFNTIIQNSGFSLLSLIDDIIDFSKIESGHIKIAFKDVSVKKVLQNIEQIFSIQFQRQLPSIEKHIDFRVITDILIDNLFLKTDENRLNQILTNLINNAIKFTHTGYIEVGYKKIKDGQLLEFYVKDTGIGINKKYQEVIFERFRKIEESDNELHRGAGLGLAICYQLVQLLKGSIRVVSQEGEGSTFYFTIPVSNSKASQINEPAKDIFSENQVEKSLSLENYKILVAEDDEANFAYMQMILETTNAIILHAETGYEVLDLLEKHNDISLILMDIKMPELNGIEALKAMQEKNIAVPAIAQTAYALSDEVKKLKEAGFNEYIAKPIIPEELYAKIKKVLKL